MSFLLVPAHEAELAFYAYGLYLKPTYYECGLYLEPTN